MPIKLEVTDLTPRARKIDVRVEKHALGRDL